MYGSGGALAYGILNAIFYGFGIAFVWIFICKVLELIFLFIHLKS